MSELSNADALSALEEIKADCEKKLKKAYDSYCLFPNPDDQNAWNENSARITALDMSIKALQNSQTEMSGTSDSCSELPNSSGDLVSRSYLLAEYDRQHQGPPGGARKIIEEAPPVQAEQKKEKWTAINKDDPATFPEEFVCVWVTGKNNCVEIAKLSDRGYWLDTDEDYMASRDWVTAWMPFEYPEPYRGDDE